MKVSCTRYELTYMTFNTKDGDRGGTVAKVLCYKLEGSWFIPSWCHRSLSLT